MNELAVLWCNARVARGFPSTEAFEVAMAMVFHAGVSLGGKRGVHLIGGNTSYILMILLTRPAEDILFVFGRLASQRLGCR